MFAELLMKISDSHNLIPDSGLVEKIIRKHPLYPCMDQIIDEVIVEKSEKNGIENRRVILGLGTRSCCKEEFEYIIYHEFGHIADRINNNFGYSEELKGQLSDQEKVCVMEIWNVYIDSRLNLVGLFQLGYQLQGYSTINGK